MIVEGDFKLSLHFSNKSISKSSKIWLGKVGSLLAILLDLKPISSIFLTFVLIVSVKIYTIKILARNCHRYSNDKLSMTTSLNANMSL